MRGMNRVAAALALAHMASVSAMGEHIIVPPVVISQFEHNYYFNDFTDMWGVVDFVVLPSGPGVGHGPGFTASVGTGDEIIVSIVAPPDRKFTLVRAPEATGIKVWNVDISWTAPGGGSNKSAPAQVTWIGLLGPAPQLVSSQVVVQSDGASIRFQASFEVLESCEFEGLELRRTITESIAEAPHEFGAAGSGVGGTVSAQVQGPALMDYALATITPIQSESVEIPPVVISELEHLYVSDLDNPKLKRVLDYVSFPSGPGTFNGPGFQASIGQGDEIVARYEAPPGKLFRVTTPPGATSVVMSNISYWSTGSGGAFLGTPGDVTWVGLNGPAPSTVTNDCSILGNASSLGFMQTFSVTSSFEFRALEIRYAVNGPVPHFSRTYGSVSSGASPSFGVQATGLSMHEAIVMSIVPAPPLCPGDANGDDQVNGADLSVLLSQFGESVEAGTGADFNGDGTVNGADLSVLLGRFGEIC